VFFFFFLLQIEFLFKRGTVREVNLGQLALFSGVLISIGYDKHQETRKKFHVCVGVLNSLSFRRGTLIKMWPRTFVRHCESNVKI